MKDDKFIEGILGKYIANKYVEAKLQEWNSYSTQITQWEIDEYLSKF